MASKASVADQQKQVQENIHSQIRRVCSSMDKILEVKTDERLESGSQSNVAPRRSGLSFAVGGNNLRSDQPGKHFISDLINFHKKCTKI